MGLPVHLHALTSLVSGDTRDGGATLRYGPGATGAKLPLTTPFLLVIIDFNCLVY